MKTETFKITNGKRQIGNLYDSLAAYSFDCFINTKRTLNCKTIQAQRRLPLYVYNYQFNFKNR